MTQLIDVADGNGNVVRLRAKKMGFGMKNRILDAAARVDGKLTTVSIFSYENAILQHYVQEWTGPDLPTYKSGATFPTDALDDLDEDFGNKIIAAINTLNKKATKERENGNADDPKESPPAGS